MRIHVNLATRPFVELRPLFLRLRIFMAALVVLGVGALVATHVLQKKLDVAAAQLNGVHAKVMAAQNEKRGNEQRMREPANAAVLTRAHFLNALFLRKSFSWTAVMMDLETVLPSGVQVTSIEPEPASNGDVMIHLRVSGDRDRAVQLVRNLERSKRFLAPRLTGEATQAKDLGLRNNGPGENAGPPPGVEFEILANYNPLPPGESYTTAKTEKKVKDERAEPKAAAGVRRRRGRIAKPSPDSFTKRSTAPRGGAR